MSTDAFKQILPQDVRSALVQGLLIQLHQRYDRTAFLLCLSLVQEESVDSTKQDLISVLQERIKAGHIEETLETISSTPWLQHSLLIELEAALEIDRAPDLQALRCIRRILSTQSSQHVFSSLLTTILRLVLSKEKGIAFAAKDILCSIIRLDRDNLATMRSIRTVTIQLLDTQRSTYHQTVGYTLWLHQLATSPALLLPDMQEECYWNFLANGLRLGDTERRKLSLEILKLSVQECVAGKQLQIVTSNTEASPTTVIMQYARFCTIFETLALARYTNLVAEVEEDLNRLASANSILPTKWLYVLMHTALASDMQDQNRKMVGNWILQGNLNPDTESIEFNDFLQRSLLPWMLEGHLFVSSVQQSHDRIWSCAHGARVSAFVQRTLQGTSSATRDRLLDTYLLHILGARSKTFSHAAVYVVSGIVQSNIMIGARAASNIVELSRWQALPDLAKELFRRDCWTLLSSQKGISLSNVSNMTDPHLCSLAGRYGASNGDVSDDLYSGRELKIKKTLQKCLDVQQFREVYTIEALADTLDDIWSDIEYLVYPRELLEAVPSALLSQQALKLLLQSGTDALLKVINTTIQRLLDLAENRSYLIAPLFLAVRAALAQVPETVSLLQLDNAILQIARSPPEPGTDLQFEYANFELLQQRYGAKLNRAPPNNEARGYAAYLSLVAQLGKHEDILRAVQDAIVSRWKQQKIPPPTLSAFKSTLQLQVLILCSEQLQHSKNELDKLLDDLFFLLSVEPLPRYRYLFSWTIIRLLMRYPDEQGRVIHQMSTTEHHANPKYLAAVMKLAIELARAFGSEEYAVKLASTFIALSASAKVVIRHEAQWSFPLLMDLAREKQWIQISDNPAYEALEVHIRALPRFDEPPVERLYARFDPSQHHTMTNLAQGLWTELDYNGPPLTQRHDFCWLTEQNEGQGIKAMPMCLELGEAIVLPQHTQKLAPKTKMPQLSNDDVVALQTKGSAYLKNVLGLDIEVAPRSHQLIVLASLVTNPYNLGGLSRVSEIFGVKQMLLGDPKVISEKDFTSVSVSSHNHIEILPLAVDDIPAYLSKKKADGWTAVGVEQTDRSEMLGSVNTKLPKKTILVIGNEREGMPGSVIT